MRSNFRKLLAYEAQVTTLAKKARIPSILEIFECVNQSEASKQFIFERENGNLSYIIGDFHVENDLNGDPDYLVLLLRRGDKLAADAVYADHKSGSYRIAAKKKDESGDSACHVFLSLKREKNKPNRYFCLIEDIPGVNHYHFSGIINKIVSMCCKNDPKIFVYNDPLAKKGGTPKTHTFVPKIKLEARPSDSFRKELDSGTINSIYIKQAKSVIGVGIDPYLKTKEHLIKIEVDKNIPGANRLSRIINSSKKIDPNADNVTIGFRNEFGVSHSVDIDISTGSPVDTLYTKHYDINKISPPLSQSTEVIVPHFSQMCTDVLLKERSI